MSKSIYTNDGREVYRCDAPGDGGAYVRYLVQREEPVPGTSPVLADIAFQHGPIPEVGVEGVTNEALLAIVHDRLYCFQQGPCPCAENEHAQAFVFAALKALEQRSARREDQGVEGTREPHE